MTLTQAMHRALARNVRALRTDRGWSLDQLADRSRVSRAMIVQVEGARTNPSIGTICQLAESLGVAVTALLETTEPQRVRVIPASEVATLWKDRHGSWAKLLAGVGAGAPFEVWEWRLAGGRVYAAPAHTRGTRELLWVHAGRLVVRTPEVEVVARRGDVVAFHADCLHEYANGSVRTACAFGMVVQLPRPMARDGKAEVV